MKITLAVISAFAAGVVAAHSFRRVRRSLRSGIPTSIVSPQTA